MVSLPESHRELGKAALDMTTVDGITIAFKDYNLFKGIWASKWNGLDTFRFLLLYPWLQRYFVTGIMLSAVKE